VPLDHDEPDGAAVSIALIRLAHTGPDMRIGSLFLNPGGPGGSGVDFLITTAPFFAGLHRWFDLVGFDPRGVARSTAVRCFGTEKQWLGAFTPFGFPVTPEEEALWEIADQYIADACDQRAGRIIDHMSTASVARDLDVLRQAVGDELLMYMGLSYGSYLGVTYANLFPDKFRALVIDGILDPVAWSTGAPGEGSTIPFSTRIRSDAGAAATLAEFFRLCDGGGSNCAFAGNGAARFAALAARLRAAPHTIIDPSTGDTIPFSFADLVGNTLGAMYSPRSWPSFAELLAYIETEVEPALIGAQLASLHQELGFITKRGVAGYRNGLEDGPSVECADSDNPESYAAWSAAAEASESQFGYFGRLWTWHSSWCARWPAADTDRYIGPFDAPTLHPVLVIGNLFDPATRYEGAVTVHDLLPTSSLITVNGWGHTAMFSSRCVRNHIVSYLVSGVTPGSDAVCAQDFVPFASPLTSAAAESPSDIEAERQVRGRLVPTRLIRAFGRTQSTQ
jgi:pimeloyl-ACP methyl ester carboxylesterase